MQIRKDKQQLQHPVLLLGRPHGRLIIKIIDDRQRVREQPFEPHRVDWLAGATALERLIGSNECFVQKMIQAQPFRDETARDRVDTGDLATTSRFGSAHNTPHVRVIFLQVAAETITKPVWGKKLRGKFSRIEVTAI